MKELIEALLHLVIAIVLLTLGVRILIQPDIITSTQSYFIILFSIVYYLIARGNIRLQVRNKEDTS